MKASVFGGRQHLKIFQSVIRFVKVDVMNLIAVGNLAVEMNASHSFSFACIVLCSENVMIWRFSMLLFDGSLPL